MFKKVKTWLKDKVSKFTFKDWLLILCGVLILGLIIYSHYWKDKSLEYYNQRGILTDSLTTYKNKLGEEYAAKNSLIMSANDLKKYNEDLWNEYKNLKNANPLVLTKTNLTTEIREIQGKNDTVWITPHTPEPGNASETQIPDLKDYKYEWSAKDSTWYTLRGETTFTGRDVRNFNARIPEFKMNSNLTLDVIDEKENLRVIAKTDNPYINVSDIQSVVIDPRKSPTLKKYFPQKRWGIGPQVGIGLTGDLKFRPYIGIGIQYSIFNF